MSLRMQQIGCDSSLLALQPSKTVCSAGDSEEHGATPAQGAGLTGLWMTNRAQGGEAGDLRSGPGHPLCLLAIKKLGEAPGLACEWGAP